MLPATRTVRSDLRGEGGAATLDAEAARTSAIPSTKRTVVVDWFDNEVIQVSFIVHANGKAKRSVVHTYDRNTYGTVEETVDHVNRHARRLAAALEHGLEVTVHTELLFI